MLGYLWHHTKASYAVFAMCVGVGKECRERERERGGGEVGIFYKKCKNKYDFPILCMTTSYAILFFKAQSLESNEVKNECLELWRRRWEGSMLNNIICKCRSKIQNNFWNCCCCWIKHYGNFRSKICSMYVLVTLQPEDFLVSLSIDVFLWRRWFAENWKLIPVLFQKYFQFFQRTFKIPSVWKWTEISFDASSA